MCGKELEIIYTIKNLPLLIKWDISRAEKYGVKRDSEILKLVDNLEKLDIIWALYGLPKENRYYDPEEIQIFKKKYEILMEALKILQKLSEFYKSTRIMIAKEHLNDIIKQLHRFF